MTQPDILLSANDEPLTAALPFYSAFGRSISFDQANILPNLAGPGTINSPATFTYNKAGNLFLNGPCPLSASPPTRSSVFERDHPVAVWGDLGVV